MNIRRRLLFGSAAAQALAPLLATAQGARKPKLIGGLSGGATPVPWESSTLHGLRDGLIELGYVEGKDFIIEWRFAEGRYDRFPVFVQEFIDKRADVIFAANTRGAVEAKRLTTSIPIVFAALSDPIGSGLVASFAQPGGNVTGVGQNHELVVSKHLELSMMAVPSLARLAVLFNPENPFYARLIERLETETQKAHIAMSLASVRSLDELEPALAAMQRQRTQAVLLLDDSLYFSNRARVAPLINQYRLPAIAGNSEYATAGLLMSYGERIRDSFQRGALYVQKIFRGARPADLPVELPMRYYLTVNLKTARAIGLTVPPALVARADQVIE